MANKKVVSKDNLVRFWQGLKSVFDTKVDKVDGKGLSTHDYSEEDKRKVTRIEDGAQVNIIETIRVNNNTQTVTNKEVNLTVPTDTADLSNGAGYQNASQVQTAINDALADIVGVEYYVCQTGEYNAETRIPTIQGEAGVIYLVPKTSAEVGNTYFEYIYNSGAFEKIGDTEIDLSNYLQDGDISTDASVNAMLVEIGIK